MKVIERSGYNKRQLFALVFSLFLLLSFTAFLVSVVASHGGTVKSTFWWDTNDTFMDFFNSVYDSSTVSNPYIEKNVIYPPIAYVFYRLVGRTIPSEIYSAGNYALRTYQPAMVLNIISLLIFSGFLIKSIYDFYSIKGERVGLILFAIMLSPPVLYAIERGNIILLIPSLIFGFLRYYDSPNMSKRVFAYFCIALAASLKIYPVIFGVLLLRRGKVKEVISCIVIGLFVFIVPFFFFPGGISNLPVMLNNIASQNAFSDHYGYGYKISVENLFKFVGFVTDASIWNSVGKIMTIFMLVLTVGFSFSTKTAWKKITLLSLAIIICPPFSYPYSIILLIPGLVIFLCDNESRKIDWLYLAMFIAPFLFYPINITHYLPVLSAGTLAEMTLSTMAQSFSLMVLGLLLFFDVAVGAVTSRSSSKKCICKQNNGP